MKVVTGISDNRNGISNTYEYAGITLHRTGLGFRGFRQLTVNDVLRSKTAVSMYNTDQYQAVLPTHMQTYAQSGQSMIVNENETHYIEYRIDLSAINKLYIIAPTAVKIRDNRAGTSSHTQYVYYNGGHPSLFTYGRPDEVITNTGNSQEITTVKFEYNTSDPYTFNRAKPKKINTISQRAGKYAYGRTVNYSYDNKSRLAGTETDPGTGKTKYNSFTYDNFGNITVDFLFASGVSTIVSNTFQYSTDGRFMIRSHNTLGHDEEYTYNVWGSPLTYKNINGRTTIYEYDGFNRLKKTTAPTGIYTTYTRSLASGQPGQPGHQQAWYVLTEEISGISNPHRTFYDYFGRPLRSSYKGFSGQDIYEDISYGAKGTVAWKTAPYFSGGTGITTSFSYDAMDRETSRSVSSGGPSFSTQYNLLTSGSHNTGMRITATNTSTGQSKIAETDATGKPVKVTENNNHLFYSYNSNGQPDYVSQDFAQTKIMEFGYDAFGNQTSLRAHNTGLINYAYDAFGRLTQQTDANGKTYTFQYDALHRVISKTGPDGSYAYIYDNGTGLEARGKLVAMQSPYNTQKLFQYDAHSRLSRLEDKLGSMAMISQYVYDNYSRTSEITYPSGDKVAHLYNAHGYPWYVRLGSAGVPAGAERIIYRITAQDAYGNVTGAGYGPVSYSGGAYVPTLSLIEPHNTHGYITSSELFDGVNGVPRSRAAYDFNLQTGNLNYRRNTMRGFQENFTYDNLDRLTQVSSNAASQLTMKYSAEGNLTGKTDMAPIPPPGGPIYIPGIGYNKYGITSIPNPNIPTLPSATQETSYTPFNKVKEIKEGSKRVQFTYGADEQRIYALYSSNSSQVTSRFYSTDYEQTLLIADGIAFQASYVHFGGRLVAVLSKSGSGTSGNPNVMYTHTDYLGSITHWLNSNGQVQQERSFDAWGRLRNPASWAPYNNTANTFFTLYDRGYTGHEHLSDLGIINMNGRLYDPVMGRMFSPDPYVVDGTNLQAYNRYSYALNNPLKYTDPDGELPVFAAIAIGAAVGAYMGGTMANGTYNPTQWDYSNGRTWGYMAGGAIVGGISAGVGAGIAGGGGFMANTISGIYLLVKHITPKTIQLRFM